MNRKVLIAVALASGLAFSLPAAHAQETPTTPEKRAQEAAMKGPEHLRWFVQRTRMIYGLSVYDFRVPE